MIRIVPEAWKKLLEPKHVVHFVGSYPEFWQQRVAGRYFRILLTQQIPYERAYILGPNSHFDLDLSDDDYTTGDIGLYPDNDSTLYEILVGMKATSESMLAYPRFPPNEYWETLEESGFAPNPASNWYRYMGHVNEDISPPHAPQLRIHTIKEEESVGLRFYNDVEFANKVVLVMLINRCLMREVKKESMTDKELERCREIAHAGTMARGYWGETVP